MEREGGYSIMVANHRYFTFEAPLICQHLPGTTLNDDRANLDIFSVKFKSFDHS